MGRATITSVDLEAVLQFAAEATQEDDPDAFLAVVELLRSIRWSSGEPLVRDDP